MKTNQFITFQKFSNKLDAQSLKARLEKAKVETILEDVSASVDVTFTGNTHNHQFLLKIRQNEFERANEILEEQAKEVVEQFRRDHYLYEFSDDELFELVEKSDEWSKEDYVLSIRILKGRGHQIDEDKLEEIKTKRLNDLRKPEAGKIGWLRVGYLFAIAGGFFGLIIGWAHWKSTKIDPTGKRFYVYNERTRNSGKQIFLLGVFFFLFWLVAGIMFE
ncbi:hypothetical protein [Pontibacter sp. G13]|uniref:hypothetical protein n=1 Tax=Pontibacter sp. G13 TaxID=3074898 RepID=UPI00288AF098|nr:hypothetical protein [Pontibacter sp. G13]WNJ17128.1 hypothetical protein RJD25_19915 [Pontibacter sp. G13]